MDIKVLLINKMETQNGEDCFFTIIKKGEEIIKGTISELDFDMWRTHSNTLCSKKQNHCNLWLSRQIINLDEYV